MGNVEPSTAGNGASQSPARQLLLRAAQREISGRGYDSVSLRSVARGAAVDPSLIRHYFGSKQNLLMAAVTVQEDLGKIAADVLEAPAALVGSRAVDALLDVWEAPATSAPALARLSASLNNPQIAYEFKEELVTSFFLAIAERVSPDHPRLRAELAAGHLMALALARYLIAEPTMAETSRAELTRVVGRTVQRLLQEPLAPEVVGRRR